jgi:hypothetical protein
MSSVSAIPEVDEDESRKRVKRDTINDSVEATSRFFATAFGRATALSGLSPEDAIEVM